MTYLPTHPQRVVAAQALIADFPEADPAFIRAAIDTAKDDAPVRASLARRYGSAQRPVTEQ